MAKKIERTPLTKTNWTSSFNITGEAVVNDYTFKIDQKSERSDWIYNTLNLGIDCGEKHGTVYTELMGGYGAERNNVVYVHGKKDDGSDDFKNQYTIDWDDRFDDSIISDIGSMCFLTVGLEKDSHDKTYYKTFLTPYDAIAYVQEHIESGMVITVRGQMRYTVYNGNIQCRKEINSIALSKATPDKYHAFFTQTMLLDEDSAGKDTIDKDKGVMYVNAYVLEKFKEFNGWDLTDGGKIKGGQFVPLKKGFEYDLNSTSPENMVKIINKIFKVKKGITQATFEGEFIEGGASVTATEDDLTDDIKELIDMGMFTLEEALTKCSTNGTRERRMVLTKINVKMVGDDDNKMPQIQKFDEVFTTEDMQMDCLIPKDTDDDEDDEPPFDDETTKKSSKKKVEVEEDNDEVSEDDDLSALLDALN